MTKYDLENRSLAFAKHIRDFVRTLPRATEGSIYTVQLIRSSSSIGANYLEANDALGRKDFYSKIKISRRDAKETCYWLQLMDTYTPVGLESRRKQLLDEAIQLVRILSSIAQTGRTDNVNQ